MKAPMMMWCVAAHLAVLGSANAQDQPKDPWIGRRVFTEYGAVLRVGNQVVDDEGRTASLNGSGKDRRGTRVYRVEHTNGNWLWLQDEDSGVSGWVESQWVVPYEQAIDFYTNRIRANPQASLYNSRGLIWHVKAEYDIAIADYNEAIRSEPNEGLYFSNRGNAWYEKKEYDKAIADYNEAIRIDPKGASAYNNRAWLWATCPADKVRDGKKAVDSATRACELNQWKDPGDLDSLAAAYVESGDFDKAVEWQEKAIKLYSGDDKNEWQKRLDLYRQKKPYRAE